jgi:glycosyltransferase involved in cell wall biosynthesis
MVSISCSAKLHAFSLAEQMERLGLLDNFYTSYAYQKNTLLRKLVRRTDKENIPVQKIHTHPVLAFPMKLLPKQAYVWNDLFDRWVAGKISGGDSPVFIGWSGMSLQSIRRARAGGKVTIVERGSSHILYQNEILREEYAKFGIRFSIDQRVIDKELKEYEEADYISIPTGFVRRSFLKYNVPTGKLLQNAYGVSSFFNREAAPEGGQKFSIVYLGQLSVRKGLIYLFEALHNLAIPHSEYEVYFIGGIDDELKDSIAKFIRSNWQFLGHVDHYKLPALLAKCSVAIQPSLEDGMGMVVAQCLACGVPVIASENCGGAEVITNGKNGYVVPVRSPKSIEEGITQLYENPVLLAEMKQAAAVSVGDGLSWADYGDRYAAHLKRITSSERTVPTK